MSKLCEMDTNYKLLIWSDPIILLIISSLLVLYTLFTTLQLKTLLDHKITLYKVHYTVIKPNHINYGFVDQKNIVYIFHISSPISHSPYSHGRCVTKVGTTFFFPLDQFSFSMSSVVVLFFLFLFPIFFY